MTVITDYIAIQADNVADLTTEVNVKITDGYSIASSIQVSMCLSGSSIEYAFVQNLAKYEEDDEVLQFDYEYKAISNDDLVAINADFDVQEGLGFQEYGSTALSMCLDASNVLTHCYAQAFVKPL